MRKVQMSVANEREDRAAASRGVVFFAVIGCLAALAPYARGQGNVVPPPYAVQAGSSSEKEPVAALPSDGGGGIVESRPTAKRSVRPDFNREIFYRHKLEYSLDV